MKAHRGQVAVYLVLVLVAIAVLMTMNVNIFLAVRSKNRMMNAADAAVIAMAKHQGALLNELGRMNVRHLRSLVDPDEEWTGEDEAAMRDIALLSPLDAIVAANTVAIQWGFSGGGSGEMNRVLQEHLQEIANEYPDPDGRWAQYAAKLGAAIGAGLTSAPGYMETANGWSQDPLLSGAFYDAIAARAWCWFGIGNRSRYFDMDHTTMQLPEVGEIASAPENSEICSLHVTFKSWLETGWADEYVAGAGFSEKWTNFVCQVAGVSREALAASPRAGNPDEVFAFYDGNWGRWSSRMNPDNIPIAGSLKPEYDVAGCVASVIMRDGIAHIVDGEGEGKSRWMEVTAEAKPLGTVIDLDGTVAPVTAYNRFIAASSPGERIFTEAQLVLMGTVPRDPGVSLSPAWYRHVKEHLPQYFEHGPSVGGCWYCQQLAWWENPMNRAQARDWLTANGETCHPAGGEGAEKGGYDWAH